MMRASLVLALALGLAACGNASPEPAAPTATATPASTPTPTATSSSTPSPPDEPARPPKPLSIHNGCFDVVTVAFGEDPKAPTTGKRTIGGDGTIDAPRDDKGNATIWLLDAKHGDEPLVSVHVTRVMKKVEVGKSCQTLDAR